jgi:hypothetical protein
LKNTIRLYLLAVTMLCAPVAVASDVDDLTALLQEFLANVEKAEVHDRFWADDLVYSSSAGLRFGKTDIMESFASSADESDEPDAVEYRGEDIDVRLYGDTAVVAFKLVGTPADGSEVLYYYNTGTFVRRDGAWQVVAWQATKIPPAGD